MVAKYDEWPFEWVHGKYKIPTYLCVGLLPARVIKQEICNIRESIFKSTELTGPWIYGVNDPQSPDRYVRRCFHTCFYTRSLVRLNSCEKLLQVKCTTALCLPNPIPNTADLICKNGFHNILNNTTAG